MWFLQNLPLLSPYLQTWECPILSPPLFLLWRYLLFLLDAPLPSRSGHHIRVRPYKPWWRSKVFLTLLKIQFILAQPSCNTQLKPSTMENKPPCHLMNCDGMKAPNLFLALMYMFLVGVEGQQLSDFLVRHKSDIESFIMIGHSEGWKQCDIISSISVQHRFLDSSFQPQITGNLERVLDMDLSIVLSSSSCILISYHINSNQSLASLVKLGAILIWYLQRRGGLPQ